MTHDDSVQIAAASPERRREIARRSLRAIPRSRFLVS
jgi:hypothetical protein